MQYMGWDKGKKKSILLLCIAMLHGNKGLLPLSTCHSPPLPLMCPMQHSHTCAELGCETPCPCVEEGG